VFSKAEVQKAFEPYTVVQLYTDTVPREFYKPGIGDDVDRRKADAQENVNFGRQVFGSLQLPLYVVLEPRLDGKIDIVAAYKGPPVVDPATFIEFLKNPQ
jgi:hypothetical protein